MEILKIKQFKCFIDAEVGLNDLTVLAGANSNGKSSAIQALLLFRSFIEQNALFDNETDDYVPNNVTALDLPLNGPYHLSLGTSSRTINKNFNQNVISLSLGSKEYDTSLELVADVTEPKLWLSPNGLSSKGKTEMASIFRKFFYYLNAERVGPRIQQSMSHYSFPNAGWQGEYTAQLINLEGGYWKVSESRMYNGTKSSYIRDQVNYWLDFIMPGIKVKATTDWNTLVTQILLENSYTAAEPTLATNLGFGTSYLLPIIVTGLVAQQDSYFVVENPEAHLHPAAQSRVGQFLAKIANTGIKVIVETHSDHIINGIQIAAAGAMIDSDKITVNFFNHEVKTKQPIVERISINKKGELSKWPKGFFDQTQLDFLALMKLRGHYKPNADSDNHE